MLLTIDEKAAAWFKQEFQGTMLSNICMFPQYAGFGEKNKGFTLAFSAETPANIGFTQEIKGITFLVDGNDVWFFEETETCMTVDENIHELQITYKTIN
ncbi:HesB/YadR/YfhF family protein [Neobacillus sp. Marseille-QA0830]